MSFIVDRLVGGRCGGFILRNRYLMHSSIETDDGLVRNYVNQGGNPRPFLLANDAEQH